MNTDAAHLHRGGDLDLPPWDDCDYFCIHDYAGTGAAPCGWRGRLRDARRSDAGGGLACPRCGFATLLRIPLERSVAADPGT